MLEDWTIYSWYCPNCKTQVAGLKNKKNQIRVICTKCGVEMVRTVVSRRHDVIDMYAPSGMEAASGVLFASVVVSFGPQQAERTFYVRPVALLYR